MQHVFKVTNNQGPSGVTSVAVEHGGGGRALVFAADCETEALAWISVSTVILTAYLLKSFQQLF